MLEKVQSVIGKWVDVFQGHMIELTLLVVQNPGKECCCQTANHCQ